MPFILPNGLRSISSRSTASAKNCLAIRTSLAGRVLGQPLPASFGLFSFFGRVSQRRQSFASPAVIAVSGLSAPKYVDQTAASMAVNDARGRLHVVALGNVTVDELGQRDLPAAAAVPVRLVAAARTAQPRPAAHRTHRPMSASQAAVVPSMRDIRPTHSSQPLDMPLRFVGLCLGEAAERNARPSAVASSRLEPSTASCRFSCSCVSVALPSYTFYFCGFRRMLTVRPKDSPLRSVVSRRFS